MGKPDMATILLSFAISNLICTLVLFNLWRQNRSRYSGLGFWLAGFTLNMIGMILLAARDTIPDFISVLGGNLCLIGGVYFLYLGFEYFLDLKNSQFFNFTLLSFFLILQTYFLYVKPSLLARNIIFTLFLVFFGLELIWLLWFRVELNKRKLYRSLGVVCILFCAVGVLRIIGNIISPPGEDLLQSNLLEVYTYLAFQMIYILLTFYLFLLINRRLVKDLEHDIEKRTLTEAALKLSEEKFSKSFKNNPNAVLITRISDGKIIEVNDSFCQLTGFSREESLGQSTLALEIWLDPEDRENIVSEVKNQSKIRDRDFNFRVKSGGIKEAQISAETIVIGGEACMLSTIRDISETKRVEGILHLRLMLWEYAANHDAAEVMQKALDEIEMLTESKIGFYHFVEEDQKTLTLKGWSTRTKNEFCKAQGEGMQYSLEKAGVWVDCVRQGKPVIHNNYSALENKKGLPDGHAEVIRELVVPSYFEGKIVSILGVGNKPTDYDTDDIKLVEYIASLLWVIVAKKKADDQIIQLNKQLEIMAMTDELTSLMNRRYFFIKGKEEVSRSRRYHVPLSMIMLDIDHFKSINDTYGHDFGDLALKCVAKILKAHIREVDIAARVGGEEFALLLPNTKLQDAAILADRLRVAISENNCGTDEQPVEITASLGVADFNVTTHNLDEMLHNADAAMYQAKHNGRNQVVISG